MRISRSEPHWMPRLLVFAGDGGRRNRELRSVWVVYPILRRTGINKVCNEFILPLGGSYVRFLYAGPVCSGCDRIHHTARSVPLFFRELRAQALGGIEGVSSAASASL